MIEIKIRVYPTETGSATNGKAQASSVYLT